MHHTRRLEHNTNNNVNYFGIPPQPFPAPPSRYHQQYSFQCQPPQQHIADPIETTRMDPIMLAFRRYYESLEPSRDWNTTVWPQAPLMVHIPQF